jgi:hypothetical protein
MSKGTKLSRASLIALVSSVLTGLIVPTALAQSLTVDQIIEKNIAARGGLEAWRDVQTMTMTGKMDAGSSKNVQLPFVLKLKRPQMSRLEIELGGKKALQIYDGENGWKVRPFLGRNEVEPYTTAEMHIAGEQAELDGYLIDHEAKGIKVELMGTDPVEGHDAYRLQLTMKDGQVRHLWVDAKSFLELKIEDPPRSLDGKMHNAETYYRNYTSIGGLMIPFVFETVVENVRPSRKITVESVAVNPKFEENAFARPNLPGMNMMTPVQRGAAQALPGTSAGKETSK